MYYSRIVHDKTRFVNKKYMQELKKNPETGKVNFDDIQPFPRSN